MNWMEYVGAFYAVYGVCWLVFAVAPVHKIRQHNEGLGQRDWHDTETLIRQRFESVQQKRAA